MLLDSSRDGLRNRDWIVSTRLIHRCGRQRAGRQQTIVMTQARKLGVILRGPKSSPKLTVTRRHVLPSASLRTCTSIDSPPWGRVRPFPAVTRMRRIPLRATGGVAAPEPVADATPLLGPEWPGCGLPGVGVVDRESTAGVELWLFPESRPLSLNSVQCQFAVTRGCEKRRRHSSLGMRQQAMNADRKLDTVSDAISR